jgi:hypothetical protein
MRSRSNRGARHPDEVAFDVRTLVEFIGHPKPEMRKPSKNRRFDSRRLTENWPDLSQTPQLQYMPCAGAYDVRTTELTLTIPLYVERKDGGGATRRTARCNLSRGHGRAMHTTAPTSWHER